MIDVLSVARIVNILPYTCIAFNGSVKPFSDNLVWLPAWEIRIETKQHNPLGVTRFIQRSIQKRSGVVLGTALVLLACFGSFAEAHAFSFADLLAPFAAIADASSPASSSLSVSQTPALRAAVNIDPNPAKGGGDISIAGGVALLSATGPEGTTADIEQATSSTQISIYVVRPDDSLTGIAKMFGVSKNTILWANNLKSASDIHAGDTLVILPVSGVEHVVTKGETITSIVKKYHGDMQDFLDFNNLASGDALAVGDTVIIPDGIDGPAPSSGSSRAGGSKARGSSSAGTVGSYERLIPGYGGADIPGYFTRPIAGGIKTQGLHGYNAVDLGTHVGTPVMAAASGTVIVARSSGYNGGYGEYIAINHPNGTQTVYGHLSKVLVSPGEDVERGQVIGFSGNTGRSTGPHLHFEVRGAANPF